ncbi:MAG: glucose-6-phosphate isomerase [Oscillospiraceae bacterium]
MPVSVNFEFLSGYVSPEERKALESEILTAQRVLMNKNGAGSNFLGWLSPANLNAPEELVQIGNCATRLIADSDAVLVIGIGGSYLGARAAVEFLVSPLYNALPKKTPEIWFIGNDLSASHLTEVLTLCEGKRVSVIVISKSGTTTEPAVAFRVLRAYMEQRYGDLAATRIVAVTDKSRGALRTQANTEGYETFAIPDDVGGRFSVLTPVGLLPIAVAGIDIEQLIKGAAAAAHDCAVANFDDNPCLQYVAARNVLLRKGRAVELFCGWDPAFSQTAEWLKQLFGESEGKGHQGLFPASAAYTTDLHSLGQFVQDGSSILFETVCSIEQDTHVLSVSEQVNDLDGLNYLAGMTLGEMTHRARRAVALAHHAGGTPGIFVDMPARTPYEYGWMLYFFEYACAVSGYTLGVNPFDQPGVEDYKRNMFALLGKPGYEELAASLNKPCV